MTPTTLESRPAEPEVLDVLPVEVGRRRSSRLLRALRVLGGWLWRLPVGAALCMLFPTSVLVVGWLFRRMQAVTLRSWWHTSRFARRGTFEEFCATLGAEAPVLRPRWLLRERIRESLAPEQGRTWRRLTIPWHSAWLNFKVGFQALFCTFLLTGWGCLLMVFSWEFGWLNSFNKGYEQAFLGPFTGIVGILLFVAAMFYVPMAQAHHAATGDYRAFFEFRFVWRLIQTRLGAYVGLAVLFLLLSLPLEILKTAPGFEAFPGNNPDWTDAQGLEYLQQYLFVGCFVLFVGLLLVRSAAGRIYAGAVLKALRQGRIDRADLHPTLARWLDRLGLDVRPEPPRHVLVRVARFGFRRLTRPVLYVTLAGLWIAFILKTYAGEFLKGHSPFVGLSTVQLLPGVANPMDDHVNRQPFVGLANHPLVQLPCFDLVPKHLSDAVSRPE